MQLLNAIKWCINNQGKELTFKTERENYAMLCGKDDRLYINDKDAGSVVIPKHSDWEPKLKLVHWSIAFAALHKGKQLRFKEWPEGTYIHCKGDCLIKTQDGKPWQPMNYHFCPKMEWYILD